MGLGEGMNAIPLKEFMALVTQGLKSPRAVVRRIIDARAGVGDRVALVALGAAVQGTLWALASLLAPSLALGLEGHALMFVVGFANYGVTTALAIVVGRRLGGRGSAADVATAVAWQSVLVAALTPIQAAALASGGAAGGGVLLLLVYAAINVWLLAACVAEAHRLESTGRVAAVIVGLFLLLAVTLSLLVGGFRGA
jgi:hypothetical protein